jgi:hypothetical protein
MLASDIAILRCLQQVSGAAAIVTIPEAAWELSLGVYLIVWGYRTSSPLSATCHTAPIRSPAVATP